MAAEGEYPRQDNKIEAEDTVESVGMAKTSDSSDPALIPTTVDVDQPESPMLSDSAFTSTPIAKLLPVTPRTQSHASLQRSPSLVQEQVSELSRHLSNRSNRSNENPIGKIERGVHTTASAPGEALAACDEEDSSSSQEVGPSTLLLSKSPSNRSARSCKSLRGIGTYEVGTLRVHSSSPARSPTEATHPCLKDGDVFVVQDMPVGVVFGYDTRVITIKELGKFVGIKNMSPGAHLIWASSDVSSLRTGFWIMTSKKASNQDGEVFVRRWDAYNEVLDEVGSKAEARNQRQSISDYADKLLAYDLSTPLLKAKAIENEATSSEHEVWQSLTSCLKGAFLSRVTGHNVWNRWPISSTHDCKRDRNHPLDPTSTLDSIKDEVLDFVFPKDTRTFSSTSLGRERTEQAIDTTSHVQAVINTCTYEDSDEIIGEMQFCFLTGMILGNSACQEHWTHIVRTVFRAYRLAVELPSFSNKFIRAFHAQLMYDETSFEGSSILDVDPSLRDDLKVILTIYKSRLTEQLLAQGNTLSPDQNTVGTSFEVLESWLWKWGWDLRGNYLRKGNYQLEDGTVVEDLELTELEAEDERGEFAPQVVHVDEEGREIGLVRF